MIGEGDAELRQSGQHAEKGCLCATVPSNAVMGLAASLGSQRVEQRGTN